MKKKWKILKYVRQINVFSCQMRYGIHRCFLPASEADRGDHAGRLWDPLRAGLRFCGHLGRGGNWWRQRMWDTAVRGNLVFLWCKFSELRSDDTFLKLFIARRYKKDALWTCRLILTINVQLFLIFNQMC